MKQILLLLTFTLISVFSFSQTEISKGTSTKLSFGEKSSYTGRFEFCPFNTIDKVNILIENQKIMIDSKVPQVYYITSEATELEDVKGACWFAMDKEGTKCRVYLYMDKNYDVYLGVEYSDFSWIYIVNPKK
jgi:hypothetical protein